MSFVSVFFSGDVIRLDRAADLMLGQLSFIYSELVFRSWPTLIGIAHPGPFIRIYKFWRENF